MAKPGRLYYWGIKICFMSSGEWSGLHISPCMFRLCFRNVTVHRVLQPEQTVQGARPPHNSALVTFLLSFGQGVKMGHQFTSDNHQQGAMVVITLMQMKYGRAQETWITVRTSRLDVLLANSDWAMPLFFSKWLPLFLLSQGVLMSG